MDAEKYPESAKLIAVADQSQTIGEFLEWLSSRGFHLARYDHEETLVTVWTPIEKLLADYYGIDLGEVERERRALLSELREQGVVNG